MNKKDKDSAKIIKSFSEQISLLIANKDFDGFTARVNKAEALFDARLKVGNIEGYECYRHVININFDFYFTIIYNNFKVRWRTEQYYRTWKGICPTEKLSYHFNGFRLKSYSEPKQVSDGFYYGILINRVTGNELDLIHYQLLAKALFKIVKKANAKHIKAKEEEKSRVEREIELQKLNVERTKKCEALLSFLNTSVNVAKR